MKLRMPLIAAAGSLLVLAGCGGTEVTDPPNTTTSSATLTPSSTPTPSPARTSSQTSTPSATPPGTTLTVEVPTTTPATPATPPSPTTPSSATPAPTRPTAKPTPKMQTFAPLKAEGVVDALRKAGYTCEKNSRYMSCAQGDLKVWVLVGTQRTLPLITMTMSGSRTASFDNLAPKIDPVLRLAHVNEVELIHAWFVAQDHELSKTRIGKYDVAISRETGLEPGTALTLTDPNCGDECIVE